MRALVQIGKASFTVEQEVAQEILNLRFQLTQLRAAEKKFAPAPTPAKERPFRSGRS